MPDTHIAFITDPKGKVVYASAYDPTYHWGVEGAAKRMRPGDTMTVELNERLTDDELTHIQREKEAAEAKAREKEGADGE
jgi:hypothetical protein